MGDGEIGLRLRLCGCGGMAGPADALAVALVLARHGFLPGDGVHPNIVPARDIPSMVEAHTSRYGTGSKSRWSVAFPVVLQWRPSLTTSFGCDDIGDRVPFCGIGELFRASEAAEVEPFTQRLVALAQDLYALVKPALGWIDQWDSNSTTTNDVKSSKLKTISWANFFGPSYVRKYGKDILMRIPGHRTEGLSDGGAFHQLTPTFLVDDARSARSLRQSVKDHFASAGVKVTCQAPFVRSRVFGLEDDGPSTTETYGTLEEFRAGLSELLATTLVLKDETRVKVVALEWAKLPAEYRKLAIAAVRDAAQVQLMDHPGTTVRLEFNEIPPDLMAELDVLARTNPTLEYCQVDMGLQS